MPRGRYDVAFRLAHQLFRAGVRDTPIMPVAQFGPWGAVSKQALANAHDIEASIGRSTCMQIPIPPAASS